MTSSRFDPRRLLSEADLEAVRAAAERAELGDQHVAPDREVRAALRIRAPEVAGTYLLELDLVRERVRWFSAADDANVYRLQIEVVDPP